MESFLPLVHANVVPDFLIRAGIRHMLSSMVATQNGASPAERVAAKQAYVADLRTRALAEHTAAANEQHYEVPAGFYAHVMGAYRKYSCGIWPGGAAADGACTLDESEAAALALVCERAGITDAAAPGFRVLDMGCGWGSFSLYCAAKFPQVAVTGVSNSASQREFIMGEAKARGLTNVNIVTSDINAFDGAGGGFDRVVSIEMMEHVKNYELLLERVASWLKTGGRFFVHIFTHVHTPFHYTGACRARARARECVSLGRRGQFKLIRPPPPDTHAPDGWMAKNFFSGGQMPSDDLLLHFQKDVILDGHWIVPGTHYERTCNEWLKKMDANKAEVVRLLEGVYGPGTGFARYVDWRLFMLACAELFGFNGGREWAVSHYVFRKR